MNHSTTSTWKFGAYAVLKRSLWVSGKNIPVFSALIVVTAATTILLNNSLEDLNQSVFVDKPRLPSVADLIITAKIIFDIMLLKVLLIYSTWRTLVARAPKMREVYTRARSFRFNIMALRLLLIPLLYFVIGFSFPLITTALLFAVISLVDDFATMLVAGGVTFLVVMVAIFFLLTRIYVVIPVAVVEQTSIFQSFARSSSLTAGSRWGIFRLLCLISVATMLVSLGLLAVIIGVSNGIGEDPTSTDGEFVSMCVFQIIGAIMSSLFSALDGIATTVCYWFLKTERDDVSDGGRDR